MRWLLTCFAAPTDNLRNDGLTFGSGTGFGIPTWLMLIFFVAVMAAFV